MRRVSDWNPVDGRAISPHSDRGSSVSSGDADQAHLRHRRRRLLARQGPDGLQPRQPAEGARSARHDAEARPLSQRRPGHDEPVPARRGLRHRRRRRDRPRHRPLRALPRHRPRPDRQRHDRPGLLERDRQGAPRRLPRRHRAGHPAHHQRDQGPHPAPWAAPTSTSSSPRSAAPSATSSRCRSSRPPARSATTSAATTCFFLHVSLVPYIGPSGELKTKPTQHSVAALRSIGIQPDAIVCRADREIPDGDQAQDLADVRRRRGGRRHRRRRAVDLRHPEGAAPRGPRRLRRAPARPAVPRRRLDRLGRPAAPGAPPQGRGHDRAGRQVHRPARRLPLGHRGAAGRRLRPRGQGQHPLGRLRRVRDAGGRRRATSATSTRSACPAASASAASRASSARCATPARTASRPSACASACSAW